MRNLLSQLAVATLCPLFSLGLVCMYLVPPMLVVMAPVGFVIAGILSGRGGH